MNFFTNAAMVATTTLMLTNNVNGGVLDRIINTCDKPGSPTQGSLEFYTCEEGKECKMVGNKIHFQSERKVFRFFNLINKGFYETGCWDLDTSNEEYKYVNKIKYVPLHTMNYFKQMCTPSTHEVTIVGATPETEIYDFRLNREINQWVAATNAGFVRTFDISATDMPQTRYDKTIDHMHVKTYCLNFNSNLNHFGGDIEDKILNKIPIIG